jgi:tRNA1(Val) A37 N6-methylase TrmN6
MADEEASGTTDDAVLGGRLRLIQPRRGHRVGHDAILLAAATAARPGGHAVDLGAGVGAAGLALAVRVPDLSVTLVEIDGALVALSEQNIFRNALAGRVRAVTLDVTAPARELAAAGLGACSAAAVLMNPPFNDPERQNASPDPGRRLAHVAARSGLARWVGTAARLLEPGGVVTLIWRAAGLADALDALAKAFGAVVVLPVHPRPHAPAVRILLRAVKASRAPLTLLAGFTLADENGRPTPEAEEILRHGALLPLACR